MNKPKFKWFIFKTLMALVGFLSVAVIVSMITIGLYGLFNCYIKCPKVFLESLGAVTIMFLGLFLLFHAIKWVEDFLRVGK